MKNFLLVVCLLCCQIIVSQCSLTNIANKFGIPVEVLSECRDRTDVSESIMEEISTTPLEHLESSRKAAFISTAGCFLACILEKTGLMKGGTIDIAVLEEASKSVKDSNSGEAVRLLKHMETCANSVKGLDQCEVAFKFCKCVRASLIR